MIGIIKTEFNAHDLKSARAALNHFSNRHKYLSHIWRSKRGKEKPTGQVKAILARYKTEIAELTKLINLMEDSIAASNRKS